MRTLHQDGQRRLASESQTDGVVILKVEIVDLKSTSL